MKAAADEDEAHIQAKVEDVRQEADSRAAELRTKTQDAATDAGSHWHEMQADWSRHIERMHQRIDATKSGRQNRNIRQQSAPTLARSIATTFPSLWA